MSRNNPIKFLKGGPKRTHSQRSECSSTRSSSSPPPRIRTRPSPSSPGPGSTGALAANSLSSHTTRVTVAPSSGGPTNRSSPWACLHEFQRALMTCTKAIGRPGAMAEDLVGCLEIHKNAQAARRDYATLRTDLEESLSTLSTHLSGEIPPIMTATMNNLYTAISNELDGIQEKERRGAGKRYLEAKKDLDEVIECYRRIHTHMKRLTLNADLSTWGIVDEQAMETRLNRLSPSMSACYDSAEATLVYRRECTPETRKQVLADLSSWRHDPRQSNLYWMNGMAGTGKTTIATSLCAMLDQSHELGASFFCSRQLPACRNVKFILPTIAYQLARFSRPFRCALSQALERDPDLHTKVLAKQFEGLFVNPLREVTDRLPMDLMVVIDALDECDDGAGVGQLLEILAKSAPQLPLKVFVSSRPEPQIRQKIDGIGSQLILHELEKSIVMGDIEIYLRTELRCMLLSDGQIAALVEHAGVLFIYAATVVRYIGEGDFSLNPMKRLENVLGTQTLSQSKKDQWIDQLYSLILSSVFDNPELEDWDRDHIKLVLHTVVCAQEPLTANALAGLLQLDDTDLIHHALRPLWSVLHISSPTNLVNTLHASFPDYMLDPARSKKYGFDGNIHHGKLSKFCFLRIKCNERQFNICELESSYLPDNKVSDLESTVLRAIPPDLLYSCTYWASHLEHAGWSDERANLLKDFLSTRLLLWMEVLNLTNRMRAGTLALEKSKSWCKVAECEMNLRELLHDAWRFTTIFATNSVSRSTPHIYASMLASWPAFRPLAIHYRQRISSLIDFQGPAMMNRQLALLNTYTTDNGVNSVAFSPDGNFIAFDSYDSIYVWDVQSGRVALGPLLTHSISINSIAFSPDGNRIASGSSDSIICIWNAQNGELVHGPLKQADFVFSVSFSPDGLRLASGSMDGSINVWDVGTGERVFELLLAHTDRVDSVSFSPDGTRIVSGSDDGTICIRDTKTLAVHTQLNTGRCLGRIGHVCSVVFSPNNRDVVFCTRQGDICVWDTLNDQVSLELVRGEDGVANVVAFSPDGKRIASGNINGSISLRDLNNGGRVLGAFEGHKGWVRSIAFSPDFTRIASGSDDRTMRIWDACYRDETTGSTEEQASPISSVAISPNGKHIASGCNNFRVYVWSLESGRLALSPLKGHTDSVRSVAFSYNGQLIASGCSRGMIFLWDAQSGDILGSCVGSEECIDSVVFSLDNRYIASGSHHNHSIRVWDIQSKENILGPLQGHTGGVRCLAFLAGSIHLVSGSDDTTVRIWDMQNGQEVPGPLQGHAGRVMSVACSPNGEHIVSGSGDNTACLWDAQSRELLCRFEKHADMITSVAFSPDGAYVASASLDKTIIIWDVKGEKIALGPLQGHTDIVTSVVFSPNGTNIMSGSRDGTVRVWSAPPRRSPTPETPSPTSLDFYFSDSFALPEPGESPESAHSSWIIEDGWVVDPKGRLLVWVPPDLRSRLLMPENTMLLAHHGSVRLNFEGANIGERWKDCYVPA